MKNFEHPSDFDTEKNIGNVEVTFSDLMEVFQGGPVVGNLLVNNEIVKGRYGGPILIEGGNIYAPAYVKRFLGTAFKLSVINILTRQITYIGKPRKLIWLDRIQGKLIYFFEDINRSILHSDEF